MGNSIEYKFSQANLEQTIRWQTYPVLQGDRVYVCALYCGFRTKGLSHTELVLEGGMRCCTQWLIHGKRMGLDGIEWD